MARVEKLNKSPVFHALMARSPRTSILERAAYANSATVEECMQTHGVSKVSLSFDKGGNIESRWTYKSEPSGEIKIRSWRLNRSAFQTMAYG
jgi:hypothetical protein